jgi:hypothetical protein
MKRVINGKRIGTAKHPAAAQHPHPPLLPEGEGTKRAGPGIAAKNARANMWNSCGNRSSNQAFSFLSLRERIKVRVFFCAA